MQKFVIKKNHAKKGQKCIFNLQIHAKKGICKKMSKIIFQKKDAKKDRNLKKRCKKGGVYGFGKFNPHVPLWVKGALANMAKNILERDHPFPDDNYEISSW